MEQKYQYNTVEEAIRDLHKMERSSFVTDDPDRENEGDMMCCSVCDPGKY